MNDKLKRISVALCKSLVVNLAIAAIWYAAEYRQFGELQWNRKCDSFISLIYFFLIAWFYYRKDKAE